MSLVSRLCVTVYVQCTCIVEGSQSLAWPYRPREWVCVGEFGFGMWRESLRTSCSYVSLYEHVVLQVLIYLLCVTVIGQSFVYDSVHVLWREVSHW